ncbi:MAG: MBL fold metallo-hydrolase [archaeon]
MRIQRLTDTVTMIQISPLDSNMYLINGKGDSSGSSRGSSGSRSLLIDTTSGYHAALIKRALTAIKLEFSDITCIINTHSHIDHIGGNHLFSKAKVMMHEKALDALKEPTLKNTLARYYKSTLKNTLVNVPLVDGDTIRVKGTKLQIIHTPGHSIDSICIYMPEEKILLSGDSIAVRIDKKISYYMKHREIEKGSLKKLTSLEINKILPGHGKIINSPQKIKELLKS